MAAPPKPALVLADANILVKDVVSASLFDMNKAGLIDLHWTPEIEAEYISIARAVEPGTTGGPRGLKTSIGRRNGSNAASSIPDPGDVHVALAAAFMAEQSKTPVVLATHDLGDFPQSALAPFDVVVLHPGLILDMLYQSHSDEVSATLLDTCRSFSNPEITPKEFLRSISGKNQFDNPELAALLAIDWKLAPSAIKGSGGKTGL